MPLPFPRLLGCAFPLLLLLPACGSVTVEPEDTPELDPLAQICGAAAPEPGPDPLVTACASLIARRAAYEKTCPGFGESFLDEKAAVDSCVGIATAPGSTLSAAEVESCAADLCLGCVYAYPSCLGNQANLLYPGHDKKGTAKPGDACVAHLQCDSGHCSAYGADCGQCQVARTVGESCTGPFDLCVDGATSCTAGICELNGMKKGEACIDYGGGDCQPTLFCKVPSPDTIDGVCAERGAAGAPCARDEHCVSGAYCNDAACAELLPDGAACQGEERCVHHCIDGTCVEPEIGLHANDDCVYGIGCGYGLTCENDKCIPQPYAAQGAACSASGGLPCGPDLACDAPGGFGAGNEDFRCVPMPHAGEPCTVYSICGPEARCVGFKPAEQQRGTCTKKGGEGDACPCVDDLACVDGSCLPFGAGMCN